MGGKMSCFTHSSEPKSAETISDDRSSSLIKSKSPKRSAPDHHSQTRRRYKEKQHHKSMQMQKELMMSGDSLTLEDSAAGFKNPRRKIHPSSSRQVPRRLISEAKDSMCLDRPMMMINGNCKLHEEEEEGGKSECLSVSGKGGGKKVRFKLPHVVILYSPEEEPHDYYYDTSEDSFYLTLEENCRGESFESPDEYCFTLAVNTLPQASFSSAF